MVNSDGGSGSGCRRLLFGRPERQLVDTQMSVPYDYRLAVPWLRRAANGARFVAGKRPRGYKLQLLYGAGGTIRACVPRRLAHAGG